ncbi:sortase [Patescibacteria group bacterium]
MAEIVIYHAYNSSWKSLPETNSGNGIFVSVSNFLTKAAKITALAGALFVIVSFTPSVWYWAKAQGSKIDFSKLILKTAQEQTLNTGQTAVSDYQPAFDPKLPLGARLEIPAIGVDTQIQEATLDNYEEALKKGVWRVSDFGTPYDRTKPVILAAHRFGYLAWTNLYRRHNSFFNLPKLKVGDTVNLIYKQRNYTYEVYATDKGEEITDYSANLILYTCESLTGPERIFAYARLLEI